MSIRIKDEPVCQPAAVLLPGGITVRQSLVSSQSNEIGKVTYTLASENNIIFASGADKVAFRDVAVTRTTRVFVHRLSLKTRSGKPNVATLRISERVVGETGAPKTAVCGVVVS